MTWQPIETAPENTEVLVYCLQYGDPVGEKGIRPITKMFYCLAKRVGVHFHYQWVNACCGGTMKPTRWMPLPEIDYE